MTYQLKELTIRTNNSETGLEMIAEVWQDLASGKLPLLFDNQHNFQAGISPVAKYSNYACDEKGDYDFSIMAVEANFFAEMERAVSQGLYCKYEQTAANDDLALCTQKAWAKVWAEQKKGLLKRAFTTDYESTVPAAYTKDGQAHCYLYIALK